MRSVWENYKQNLAASVVPEALGFELGLTLIGGMFETGSPLMQDKCKPLFFFVCFNRDDYGLQILS